MQEILEELKKLNERLDIINDKIEINHRILESMIKKESEEVHLTYNYLNRKFEENQQAIEFNRLLTICVWAFPIKNEN